MSRQLQNCERLLNELKDRLGEDDPLVAQWQDELAARDAFEFRYPSKWPRVQVRSPNHVERRPWANLFDRPNRPARSAVAEALRTAH